MGIYYTIHFPDQLRQHLRALRKKRRLTQAQAGALIGVSQARLAEIEANPGLVSLDQILQLCSALGSRLALEEEHAAAGEQGARSGADDMLDTPDGKREAPHAPPRPERVDQAATGTSDTDAQAASLRNAGSRRKKGTW